MDSTLPAKLTRFVIQRERTQIHRTVIEAPSQEVAEAFANDQDFDEDDYETTEYERVIREQPDGSFPVVEKVTADKCPCCGSLSPWRCDCRICRQCEGEFSPATSDAKSHEFWCSAECEQGGI